MFLKYNLFGIIWAMLIASLIFMPGQQLPDADMWSLLSVDKVVHVILFAILVLLMIVGFSKQHRFKILKIHPVALSFAISIAYGAFTELVQTFIPARQVEFQDLLANVTGCFAGYGLFFLIYKV